MKRGEVVEDEGPRSRVSVLSTVSALFTDSALGAKSECLRRAFMMGGPEARLGASIQSGGLVDRGSGAKERGGNGSSRTRVASERFSRGVSGEDGNVSGGLERSGEWIGTSTDDVETRGEGGTTLFSSNGSVKQILPTLSTGSTVSTVSALPTARITGGLVSMDRRAGRRDRTLSEANPIFPTVGSRAIASARY